MDLPSGISYVGAKDAKRKLFDEIVALPKGTSYNSYLVEGSEKVALIDTVDPTKTDVLLSNIEGVEHIDYIISNHAEQDHSGSLPIVLEKYPDAVIVTNEKCKHILQDELDIHDEKFKLIVDGEKLSLGDKTLHFIFTPWVHWPETMCTYVEEDKILFTCDFFGSHLASDITVNSGVDEEMKRYYAEIMMPFAKIIRKNIERVKSLRPEIIAPSHGPVYTDPNYPIKLYEEWTSDEVKEKVVILYASMHGSTKLAVDHLVNRLGDYFEVQVFNVTGVDHGELAMALIDAAALVVASPTFLGKLHPNVAGTLYLLGALRPKTKVLGFIGSYEWGGAEDKDFDMLTQGFNAEKIKPFMFKGKPKEADYEAISRLVAELVEKVPKHL